MKILLTGGTGYIGSHTAIVLTEAGHHVTLFDNLCNSEVSVVDRLQVIRGKRLGFVEADIRDTALLEQTLTECGIEAVFHFAGLKAVGESVQKPVDYYANNVQGTVSLLQAMQSARVHTLVFSSSATVYGEPQYLPIDEAHPTSATSPYGRSKLHIEEVLKNVTCSKPAWRIACMRYFNPVGVHESALIGEDPQGTPNNLMPFVARVASGSMPHLNIFGNDYPTVDGTGVRDYIHIMDLAEGHLAAIEYLQEACGWHAINLGTLHGSSVLEMVQAFESVTGKPIPYRVADRRAGDIPICYAKAEKAMRLLNWKATRAVHDMCESTWKFQRQLQQS